MIREYIQGIVELDEIVTELKNDHEYYHIEYVKLVRGFDVVVGLKILYVKIAIMNTFTRSRTISVISSVDLYSYRLVLNTTRSLNILFRGRLWIFSNA